jgi:2-keto-4-pentenoate hydratase/2-oxohepta-3-ene-1,7-dioic acid hydratase in catechol pathway
MRYARYSHEDRIAWGRVEDGASGPQVSELEGDPFDDDVLTGRSVALDQVRLLAPYDSAKVVGFGMNYPRPTDPDGGKDDRAPFLFVKPPTAVVGPGDPIVLPGGFERILHEVELAVVIGRTCRHVKAADAESVIFGYTCANDVSALGMDSTSNIPQVVLGKSYDSFCPLGPWIETELDSGDQALTCRVNGELRQDGNSGDMRRGIAGLIELASAVMTLGPGDIVLTGTVPGAQPLHDGDLVEVAVGGIGSLSNPVVAASA